MLNNVSSWHDFNKNTQLSQLTLQSDLDKLTATFDNLKQSQVIKDLEQVVKYAVRDQAINSEISQNIIALTNESKQKATHFLKDQIN